MKLTHFFRISWSIQLLVGLGLFIVSFMIESTVLQAFIATPLLAGVGGSWGSGDSVTWSRSVGACGVGFRPGGALTVPAYAT